MQKLNQKVIEIENRDKNLKDKKIKEYNNKITSKQLIECRFHHDKNYIENTSKCFEIRTKSIKRSLAKQEELWQ